MEFFYGSTTPKQNDELALAKDPADADTARGEVPSKRPRPVLRPHTGPDVVLAREKAKPKPLRRDFGESLVDEFASGSSSACRVAWHCQLSSHFCIYVYTYFIYIYIYTLYIYIYIQNICW